jgi:hypothetical protein
MNSYFGSWLCFFVDVQRTRWPRLARDGMRKGLGAVFKGEDVDPWALQLIPFISVSS